MDEAVVCATQPQLAFLSVHGFRTSSTSKFPMWTSWPSTSLWMETCFTKTRTKLDDKWPQTTQATVSRESADTKFWLACLLSTVKVPGKCSGSLLFPKCHPETGIVLHAPNSRSGKTAVDDKVLKWIQSFFHASLPGRKRKVDPQEAPSTTSGNFELSFATFARWLPLLLENVQIWRQLMPEGRLAGACPHWWVSLFLRDCAKSL